MVSCGTPGRRAAYPRASFLYHSVRLPMVKELTEIKAKRYFEDMQRENEFVQDLLTRMALLARNHFLETSGGKEDFLLKKFIKKIERFQKTAQALGFLPEDSPKTEDLISEKKFEVFVREVYEKLLKGENCLTPYQAKDLFLIDRVGTT